MKVSFYETNQESRADRGIDVFVDDRHRPVCGALLPAEGVHVGFRANHRSNFIKHAFVSCGHPERYRHVSGVFAHGADALSPAVYGR